MVRERDMGEVANQIVPNPGDEAWVVDPNQPEHYHSGQKSGEPHNDGYHLTHPEAGRPGYQKYHSDDR